MATSDDDVREIQLSGKQLVFLFMAVTVVSVVIFLCGVLVGRGVQTRATAAAAAGPQAPAAEDAPDPTASSAVPGAPPAEPTKATGLGYQERLEGAAAPAEKLAARTETSVARPPAAATPREAPAVQGAPAPAAVASPSGPPARDAASAVFPEPKGDGFAIQVAALTGRAEAEAVAARLKGKGYAVYLVPALAGQPAGFRVRVGKFKARAEAEKIAERLERDEQFKPWITR